MNKDSLDKLLTYAVKKGASDVHLSAGSVPVLRIHGELRRVNSAILTDNDLQQTFQEILNEEQQTILSQNQELDFAYAIPQVARFRTNLFFQLWGPAAAFRVIPDRIRALEELKVPQGVHKLARERNGLILVTGPTGSGKSTTLAAIIDFINQERKDHILTIEDPIEYVHKSKNCLINQRELGAHTRSFAGALRSALREDPDVILVGEMRDLETISLALTAAETGHLVLSTLHTINTAETVNRIVDVFPAAQQSQIRAMFANSIRGIISQMLLPLKNNRGRVAAMEVLIATPAVRSLIREQKSHQLPSVIETGSSYGMQTMDQALKDLLNQGLISREVALEHASSQKIVLG